MKKRYTNFFVYRAGDTRLYEMEFRIDASMTCKNIDPYIMKATNIIQNHIKFLQQKVDEALGNFKSDLILYGVDTPLITTHDYLGYEKRFLQVKSGFNFIIEVNMRRLGHENAVVDIAGDIALALIDIRTNCLSSTRTENNFLFGNKVHPVLNKDNFNVIQFTLKENGYTLGDGKYKHSYRLLTDSVATLPRI